MIRNIKITPEDEPRLKELRSLLPEGSDLQKWFDEFTCSYVYLHVSSPESAGRLFGPVPIDQVEDIKKKVFAKLQTDKRNIWTFTPGYLRQSHMGHYLIVPISDLIN